MARYDALTEEERRLILAYADEMTISEIALAVGRSYSCVQRALRRFGAPKAHRWTPEEDAQLLSLYGRIPTRDVARRMKLDVNGIYNRIIRIRKRKRKNT